MITKLFAVAILLFLVVCNTPTSIKNPSTSQNNTTSFPITHNAVTDADGNSYDAVTIGTQTWTIQNLRTTKYNDGSDIPLVSDSAEWNHLTTPAYCFYNTNDNDHIKYGALYNEDVVYPSNPKNIAPTGWHVSSDQEWTTLEKYLILNGYTWDGTTNIADCPSCYDKIAKSLATKTDWFQEARFSQPGDLYAGVVGNDLSKNNSSGFSAFPAGFRSYNMDLNSQLICCYWWTSTVRSDGGGIGLLWTRSIGCENTSLDRESGAHSDGFSIRLIKD